MTHPEIRQLVASDGMPLKYRCWIPENPIGVVICLHGIQSHSGWYDYSCRRMCDANFAVYFADRRGSGMNNVKRGHADHAIRLLNDVAHLIHEVRKQQHGIPVTLLGVSWGGKLAAAFGRHRTHQIDQLALLYPGMVARIRPNLWQRFLLWFARTHDIRHRNVRLPLNDAALFTDSPEWQQFIDEDPLALRAVTTGMLNAGLMLDRLFHDYDQCLPPTLLMLAGKDQIIDNNRTLTILKEAGPEQLVVREYADARHTLEFDGNREQIFTDLIDWLRDGVRHLKNNTRPNSDRV